MKEAVKEKKVFILGNGFDCCLGWHTKYSDFVQSDVFKTIPEDSGLASHLIRNASLDKWLDIEKELYKYAMPVALDIPGEFDVFSKSDEDIKKDSDTFEKLKQALKQYLTYVQEKEEIDNRSFAAKVLRAVIANGKFDDIYTFNYTNLSAIGEKLQIKKMPFSYVHGSLEYNDLIIGTDDHKSVIKGYDFLYKTFDKNYPSSPIQYSLQDANEVVFFGHSLGETDFHYFENFFLRQSRSTMGESEKKKITIFTYDNSSRLQILRQLREKIPEHSLDLLYANNDFSIICTDGSDPKDEEKLKEFCQHLHDCSVAEDLHRKDQEFRNQFSFI